MGATLKRPHCFSGLDVAETHTFSNGVILDRPPHDLNMKHLLPFLDPDMMDSLISVKINISQNHDVGGTHLQKPGHYVVSRNSNCFVNIYKMNDMIRT